MNNKINEMRAQALAIATEVTTDLNIVVTDDKKEEVTVEGLLLAHHMGENTSDKEVMRRWIKASFEEAIREGKI